MYWAGASSRLRLSGTAYHVIRFTLATVLLAAAVLKSVSLIPGSRPWAAMLVVCFESLLAAWLISGHWRRECWTIATACFTVFAAVATWKISLGAANCGCFSVVEVSPWISLAVDVSAVGALVAFFPRQTPMSDLPVRPRRRIALKRIRSESQCGALVLVACAIVVIAISSALMLISAKQSSEGLLRVAGGTSLDLGRLPVSSHHEMSFQIENITSHTLSVEKTETSCGCVTIAPSRFRIEPRQQQRITAILDLGAQPDDALSPEWDFRASLRSIISIPGRTAHTDSWAVKARIYSPVVLSTRRVVFPVGSIIQIGNTARLAEHYSPMPLTFDVVTPLSSLKCSAAADIDVTTAMPELVGPGYLTIVPRENLDRGNSSRKVVLSGHTTSGAEFNLNIDCVLPVVDDIVAEPDILVVSDSRTSFEVALRSRLGYAFRVTQVLINNTVVNVENCVHYLSANVSAVRLELSQRLVAQHMDEVCKAIIKVGYLADHLEQEVAITLVRRS